MPMGEAICRKLQLPQMVEENTDNHSTAFTVSIDHVETTTGISAEERGFTARKCVDKDAKPEDFRRPGHMFPLLSKKNGVLERNGHTEATVDLMRLSGLEECGLCCEIMRDDGTMMRTPELKELAAKHDIKFITIKDLQEYRKKHDQLVECVAVTKLPTKFRKLCRSRLCEQAQWRTPYRPGQRRHHRRRGSALSSTLRVPDRRRFRFY